MFNLKTVFSVVKGKKGRKKRKGKGQDNVKLVYILILTSIVFVQMKMLITFLRLDVKERKVLDLFEHFILNHDYGKLARLILRRWHSNLKYRVYPS